MSQQHPTISVVIAVHNGVQGLAPTIASLRLQTFTDFETIIVDDGSTDETPDLIERLGVPNLRLHRLTENMGQTAALNVGISMARGKYIVRHDVEDISAPGRFKQQVAFLERHRDHALVGSHVRWVDAVGRVLHTFEHPTDHTQIAEQLPHKNAFGHGAVTIRRAALEDVGGYREAFRLAQDLDLWLRLAEKYYLANLPEPLYSLRYSPHMASIARHAEQDAFAALARQLAEERRRTGQEITDLVAASGTITERFKHQALLPRRAARAADLAGWARRFQQWGGGAEHHMWKLWLRGLLSFPLSPQVWRVAARMALKPPR